MPATGDSSLAAQIQAVSDRYQSGNDISTALVFGTFNSPYSGVGVQGFAERMRIAGTGNVGIGTASPAAKLDVAGDGRFQSKIVTSTNPLVFTEGAELNSVQIPIPASGDGSIILAEANARINGIFHLYWEGPNRVHDIIFAANAYHFYGGEVKILSQAAYGGRMVFSNLRLLMRGDGYHIQLVVDIGNRADGVNNVRLSMLSGRANHLALNPGGSLYPSLVANIPDVTAGAVFQQGPSGPAIEIKNGYTGKPRIQLYDLNADPQAWLGSGVDMSGHPYEHSLYFPATSGNAGRFTVGSYNGVNYDPKLTLLQDGRLGLGTTNPTERLQINDGSIMIKKVRTGTGSVHPLLLGTQHVDGVAGVSGVAIREEGMGGYGQASGLVLMTSTNDQNPVGQVYITSTGNVGVGDSHPTVPLQVQGAVKASGSITAGGVVTAPKIRIPQSGDLSMGAFTASGPLGAPSL